MKPLRSLLLSGNGPRIGLSSRPATGESVESVFPIGIREKEAVNAVFIKKSGTFWILRTTQQ